MSPSMLKPQLHCVVTVTVVSVIFVTAVTAMFLCYPTPVSIPVLLFSGLMVHEDKWRGETVLQSSYISQLLNMGQITQDHTPQGNIQ